MKTKIYTKKGDKGLTGLISKKTLSKSDVVFEVLGTLDEFSALLGFLSLSKNKEVVKSGVEIQSNLFLVGSLVAGSKLDKISKENWGKRILELEKTLDYFEAKNSPINHFILSGGSMEACYLHNARAVCRRLERIFVKYLKLSKRSDLKIVEPYLNRLSDLLFVMARFANKKTGYKDVLWKNPLAV